MFILLLVEYLHLCLIIHENKKNVFTNLLSRSLQAFSATVSLCRVCITTAVAT